jgi:uncharacterized membrane protein YdjX (TVP38/TMEM64 family)
MVEEFLGLAGLFLLMVVQVVIPPIPAEVIVILAGHQYGVAASTLVAGSGLFLGSMLVYRIGHFVHDRYFKFFSNDKVARILDVFQRHGAWVLWVRLLPYNPSDIISYAAGIARLNPKTFLLITAVTSFLRCFLLSNLGGSIENWKGVFYAITLMIISAVIAMVLLFSRKKTREQ